MMDNFSDHVSLALNLATNKSVQALFGVMSTIFDALQRVTGHFFCNERPHL